MGSSENILVKVVYFDESSALDYIDIEHKGRKTKSKESEANAKAGASVEVNATTPKILNFLKAQAKANVSADAQRIVKNQVANTILTDFLRIAKSKKRFEFFKGYSLSIFKNSTTYYKTLSPVAKALKGEMPIISADQIMNLEVSQIGSIVEGVQGYSEFIAIEGSHRYVFRFNDLALRNNYRLLDMPKMSMGFYGIKVGSISEKDLTFDSLYAQDEAVTDIQSLVESMTGDGHKNDLLDVYDIVLAGIFVDDKK